MPRLIHPALPRYDFHTDVQIYISHVNQGGHLDNAQLLSLVSEARVRFFKALGYRGEGDIEGAAVVVGDLLAQYKSEGFHGETLRVEMAARDFNRYGFDLQFRMHELQTGREVALGKTGIVFVDPKARQVTPIPASVQERLQAMAKAAT
ncbi:MAG: thioesterase family protein [Pseudomonadota bacterium]|nr:thioesterase family protein [Pseudomonadota bacterium]